MSRRSAGRAAAAPSGGLSPYEIARLETMRANQAQLEALGLDPLLPPRPSVTKKLPRVKRRCAESAAPARKSARFAQSAESPSGAPERPTRPELSIRPWWEDAFDRCERGSDGRDGWDRRRAHQHLTISPSGRCVATTGVAGYGAALCSRRATTNAHGPGVRWLILAERFGVGGFCVGVVRAAMKPPYKSLRTSADAIGAYLASGALMSRGRELPSSAPPYDPGDTIGVQLRRAAPTVTRPPHRQLAKGGHTGGGAKSAQWEIAFLLNGVEVGAVSVGVGDALALAVQPYMGGVAMLV